MTPPSVRGEPRGGSAVTPKPDLDPLTKEENQDALADAQEENPQPQAANPAPIPKRCATNLMTSDSASSARRRFRPL